MESYQLSETSEEDLDDPITLVVNRCNSQKSNASPLSVHDGVKGRTKTPHNFNQSNNTKDGGIFFNIPDTFFENPRTRLLLRQCRQMSVEVVKCDSHVWFHRKLIALQKLNPKVSVPLQRYLDKTCNNKDNNDEIMLMQHNVRIVGGNSMPLVTQNKESGQPAHEVSLEGNVRPQPVGNFMVCDNSVMTKRSSGSGDAQPQPVKLKIKEILTIKEMSPKRLSQIDFKKNKGLIGMKISRESIDPVERNDKKLISKKTVTGPTPVKVVAGVKNYEKPGPKRTKTTLSSKYVSKLASPLTAINEAHKANDAIIKPGVQTLKESNTTAAYNNVEHCPLDDPKKPNVTKKKELLPKAFEKDKNDDTTLSASMPGNQNSFQVRNDLVSEVPNSSATNVTQPVITKIKTEKEIKKEVPCSVNENLSLLSTPQGFPPLQAAPVKSMEPNVTSVYNNVNQIMTSSVVRPTLQQGQPQGQPLGQPLGPHMNHNQHLHNNAVLPTPFQSFQNPTPVLDHGSEISLNYIPAQPNWQQYEHINTQDHFQIPSLTGPITQQYQAANMQWNNPQNGVNANAYYQDHMNFQGHQSQMITPPSTQVNVLHTTLPPQYVSNPMMPSPLQNSANILAPTQTTLNNTNIASATSQGVVIHNMNLPAPQYPDHLRNSVLIPVYGSVTNAASNFPSKNIMPSSFSQSSAVSTNTTTHHNKGVSSSKAKVTASSKRKALLHQRNQSVSQNTPLIWSKAPISNATTTNSENPYNNQGNYPQIGANDSTNPKYDWHVPSQLPAPMYGDPNNINRVLTNDTGEIKKVSLVTIRKKLCGTTTPSILKQLRDKIQAKSMAKVGTIIQGSLNPTTIKLPETISAENALSQTAKPYVNNNKETEKEKPAKRVTYVKRAGPIKKAKVGDFGVSWTEQAEAIPTGYSPPILPLPSVQKTYDILMNSQQLRFRQNTLSPATMEIMKWRSENTWPPSHIKIIDSRNGKEKAVKDIKKISLEEYKNRAAKSVEKVIDLTDDKNQWSKQKGTNTNNFTNNCKVDNYDRRSVDSQDLGYGSDSTVRL